MSETVYQGDTLELEYTVENRNLSVNWQCVVQIKKSADEPALIDLNLDLNPQQTEFTGLMDTTPLAPSVYWVFAEMSNVATGERCEVHQRIVVRKQGVLPSQ